MVSQIYRKNKKGREMVKLNQLIRLCVQKGSITHISDGVTT